MLSFRDYAWQTRFPYSILSYAFHAARLLPTSSLRDAIDTGHGVSDARERERGKKKERRKEEKRERKKMIKVGKTDKPR